MGVLGSEAPTIVAENVQVRYTVATRDPNQRSGGLQRLGDIALGRQAKTTVRALRGVNFVAREGEMVGIVGSNGSGKSTFLRNVAGVEQPDRGRILVRYQPLLLGVSAALQPSLSGSENVRLGCLAMGLTPEEADSAYEYVTELSALGSAIHRPMETYSSGMGSRLRFAIALAAQPKILLIDEALSTGDATFAERSERAMDELLAEAGTVLLVNHAAKVIQELCTRAVWMHRGEIIMDGPAESVAEKYRWWAWNVAQGKEEISDKLLHDVVSNSTKEQINVLEPELIKNPVPRHAARPTKKFKKTKQSEPAARHVKRSEYSDPVEDTEASLLAKAESQVWPAKLEKPLQQAKFPVLPKRASQVLGSQTQHEPPPLKLRPSGKRIILRAENPDDRASSVAAKGDLTGRRLAARARAIADQRYQDRLQARAKSGNGLLEQALSHETNAQETTSPGQSRESAR